MTLAGDRAARVAVGAVVFAAVACVSYAAQRLAALGNDPALVFAQAHIPYFGRIAIAAIHGGMVALLAGTLAPDPAVVLRAGVWWVPAAVVPAAVAMAVYP